MRINRDNYESYLIDYAEGNLSSKMKYEVKQFLLLHPDIQEEFDMFNSELLEKSNITFSDKETLKKIPFEKTTKSSEYFQQLCVDHIEGLLPKDESAFLKKLIKEDASKRAEFNVFEKTKLIVEKETFNEKLLIKKPEIIHDVTSLNFEEYCVACVEGWLDQSGLVSLNEYIAQNPKQKRELDIYLKTRLIPDFSIVYPDKRKIKRYSILSPTIKKYLSVISSAAAIITLAFMVFYTTTLDDKTKLSSSLTSQINNSFVDKGNVEENLISASVEDKKQRQLKAILHDPFGFEKISGKKRTPAKIEFVNLQEDIERIKPIQIVHIDCPPCKQMFENQPLAITKANPFIGVNKLENEKLNNQKTLNETQIKSTVWEIAQAGISGLNKITNTELSVEKKQNKNKTKIAFNSRYFSFSTNVNKNN